MRNEIIAPDISREFMKSDQRARARTPMTSEKSVRSFALPVAQICNEFTLRARSLAYGVNFMLRNITSIMRAFLIHRRLDYDYATLERTMNKKEKITKFRLQITHTHTSSYLTLDRARATKFT